MVDNSQNSNEWVTSHQTFERMERAGYLPALRKIAMGCCIPFWWHGARADGSYGIFHNGTLCLVNTGTRQFGVTASHVYKQYICDKTSNETIVCQFGSSTILPEEYLIEYSEEQDIVTFELSDIIIGATGASAHHSLAWPPEPLQEGEVIIVGGYPGILRTERPTTADIPFQWFAQAITSVSPINLGLHLNLQSLHWLNRDERFNPVLGGMSGGPVFRLISTPIERLELVGFIYEYQENFELMLARPASCVCVDGSLSAVLL